MSDIEPEFNDHQEGIQRRVAFAKLFLQSLQEVEFENDARVVLTEQYGCVYLDRVTFHEKPGYLMIFPRLDSSGEEHVGGISIPKKEVLPSLLTRDALSSMEGRTEEMFHQGYVLSVSSAHKGDEVPADDEVAMFISAGEIVLQQEESGLVINRLNWIHQQLELHTAFRQP